MFPASLLDPAQSEISPLQPYQDEEAANNGNGLPRSAAWPEEPEPVNRGENTRADRLRMLRQMRLFWNAVNAGRRDRVKVEVQVARERQAEVTRYWDRHRSLVKERWVGRTGQRGETNVADIPEVAAQWHPDSPLPPERVSATAQHAATGPYRWQCPLGLGHAPWPAWPKDRIQTMAASKCQLFAPGH